MCEQPVAVQLAMGGYQRMCYAAQSHLQMTQTLLTNTTFFRKLRHAAATTVLLAHSPRQLHLQLPAAIVDAQRFARHSGSPGFDQSRVQQPGWLCAVLAHSVGPRLVAGTVNLQTSVQSASKRSVLPRFQCETLTIVKTKIRANIHKAIRLVRPLKHCQCSLHRFSRAVKKLQAGTGKS